ncbi:MAG: hypothetical protein IJF35_02175 [Clostridia bacterium]|nr:hypothetical protein [Clostridia bacterium]
MKKILSLLLAIFLLLPLCSCGKTPAQNDIGKGGFVKPDSYASVITVTINPQFRLYLDKDAKVLAVEAINSDAETVIESLELKNVSFETAIEKIVTTANDKGYIKADAQISFKVTETKIDEINADEILSTAKTVTNATAAKINITVAVNIDENPTADNSSSSEVTSYENTPSHTHSFSAATCTEPKKCSCGATDGKALGHNFVNRTCTRCLKVEETKEFTLVGNKNGSWGFEFANEQNYYRSSLIMYGDINNCWIKASVGDLFSTLPEDAWDEIRTSDEYKKFNGKEYYVANGEMDKPAAISCVGTTKVTITDKNGKKLTLTRTGEDTMTVASCDDGFTVYGKVPTGTKLTFKAN